MVKTVYAVLGGRSDIGLLEGKYGDLDIGVLEGQVSCACVGCHRDELCDVVIKEAEDRFQETLQTPFVKVLRTREEADEFIKQRRYLMGFDKRFRRFE